MTTSEPDASANGTDRALAGASPYATGGGGTRLEHRVACLFLARLLNGSLVHELAERAPTRVALQQDHLTSVDDIVVEARAPDGVSLVRLDIAVRRRPQFIQSHTATGKLVTALVDADLAASREATPLVERRLAVAVSGHFPHARELAELALLARAQSNVDDFFALLRVPGKVAACRRLDHLLEMVRVALAGRGEHEVGTPERRCWSLLRRLWVMPLELEAGNERDWTAVAEELSAVAIGHTRDAAVALRDRLEQLAGELGRSAASLDAAGLRRRLHGEIASNAHPRPAGWRRLRSLDTEARSVVARSIAGSGTVTFTLPRQAIRDAFQRELASGADVLVHGDSGVGKSALVMDATDPDRLGPERQAIAINLRHLPRTPLELEALLIDPLDTLLTELSAPERSLIVDAAESATEGYGEVFSYLAKVAREAGFALIVVTTSEGAAIVRQRLGGEPHELEIPGLGDEELAEAAAHVPALQRLVDNVRARELLRRPIIIDLLSRAGVPGLPLNESQALEHVWEHLVRRGGGPDQGVPDARDQVMLHLAAHEVRGGDVDALLARLDLEAVDGLRRGDVLLPASPRPWERVPAFKHDLVRAYAVARFLLRERDPAAALLVDNAPRWTLSSARLACETVLSEPDAATYPRRGRFAALQRGFEAIAHRGGERWADVPTEALLTASEPRELLEDAWPALVDDDARGLARLIRVLNARHRTRVGIDPLIAEPVITCVLVSGRPNGVSEQLDELVLDWLRTRALRSTPAGNELRVRLREHILQRCAENEHHLDVQEAARRQALAERTPEEIAADEDRRRRIALFGGALTPRNSRLVPDRHRPCLWIEDVEIECLALLGPDLDARGEAILRRIAEDEPRSLIHAIEPPVTGHTLAGYDPTLLIDLSAAYYIEQEDDGLDGLNAIDRLGDGIRGHRYHGLGEPLSSYTYGPFVALFRADYLGGVAFLNRMLDHAAGHRARVLATLRGGAPFGRGLGEDKPAVLSIAGEPREFVGDAHVWGWYRGTSVGPYPCTSALQALEFVTEEYIRAGVPPQILAARLLEGAHNLAMPALALGVLVRHLDVVGEAIDPYLAEPLVWTLESSRVAGEYAGAPTAHVPDLPNPDRRSWGLGEVSTVLTLRAEGDRVVQLKRLGEALEAAARALAPDEPPDVRRRHLAIGQRWASILDRHAYEVTQDGDQLRITQVVDPEIDQVLQPSGAALSRANDAAGLLVRHVYRRDSGDHPFPIENDILTADLVIARELAAQPAEQDRSLIDGPIAVAASAVALHLGSQVQVSEDDLSWSTAVLIAVASHAAPDDDDAFDGSIFSQGADRSAARALPYLLLPNARALRAGITAREASDPERLIAAHRGVAVDSVNETRLAYARALDVVWTASCDTEHLLVGRCHHRIAFELVTASFVDSVIGEWVPGAQRRPILRLDPPVASSLDGVEGEAIHASRLIAALRASSSAAVSSACCANEAKETLTSLIAAHQRAMLSHEHGHHHSHSDALVTARAALWQALDGDDETVLRLVTAFLPNSRLLSETLQAISAAAQERPDTARHARRLWPRIMDLVLDAAEVDPNLFTERMWGSYAESALIPNPVSRSHYLTIEGASEPFPWRDPVAWSPQVNRWLDTISCSRMSIDHLVIAVRELAVAVQTDQGLRWIEHIVSEGGNNCADTFTLPEWLRERRVDLVDEEQISRWQRVVDRLVVAGDDRVADLSD